MSQKERIEQLETELFVLSLIVAISMLAFMFILFTCYIFKI